MKKEKSYEGIPNYIYFWQMTFNILSILVILVLVSIIFRELICLKPTDQKFYQMQDRLSRENFSQNLSHQNQQEQLMSQPQNSGVQQDQVYDNLLSQIISLNQTLGMQKTTPPVFLYGGTAANAGILFALNRVTGIVGPVCDDTWNIRAAHVACKQLGFIGAILSTSGNYFGPLKQGSLYAYGRTNCKGNETKLEDCAAVAQCSSNGVAGVICDPGFQIAITVAEHLTSAQTTSKILKCHQCTTLNDNACDDSFWTDGNRSTLNTTKFFKDCPATDEIGEPYRSCIKVHTNYSSVVTIQRGCSTLMVNKFFRCYHLDDALGNSFVTCNCVGEGCNESQTLRSWPFIIVLVTGLITILSK